MRLEYDKNIQVETIYDAYKPNSKSIDNVHILIFSESGHGKTIFEESIAQEYHEHGYNVIVPTEKAKHRLEFAFCMFEPNAKYHLGYLVEQGKEPKMQKAKIHALWAFNLNTKQTDFNFKFWNKKIYPFEFFTIDVKNDLNPDLWSILFEVPVKNFVVRAVSIAQQRLNKSQGLRDLKMIAIDLIKSNKIAGTQNDVDVINTVLDPLIKLGFMMPENCKYNLDFKDIFADTGNYHIFHYGFLSEGFEKMEYFAVSIIMNKLVRTYQDMKKEVHKSKSLSPVMTILQEVNAFLPDRTDKYYITITGNLIENILKQVRVLGISSCAEGQNVYRTAEGYRESVPNIYYGRLSTMDVERLSKVRRYPVNVRNRLESMPKSHYMKKGDYKERVALFPTHRHCEEGEDFHVEYSKEHPNLLRKHKDVYTYIFGLYDEERKREVEHLKAVKAEKQKKNVDKKYKEIEKLEKTKEEKDVLKKQLKETVEKVNEKLYIEIYQKSKLNPDGIDKMSWAKLSKMYNLNDKTAKKYAYVGKELVSQSINQPD